MPLFWVMSFFLIVFIFGVMLFLFNSINLNMIVCIFSNDLKMNLDWVW